MACRSVFLVLLANATLSFGAEPDLIIWGPTLNPKVVSRTFSASSCEVIEGCAVAGLRRLLVFDTETRNIGGSDLVLGNPANNPLFEYAPCHNHYHFRDFADYRLVDSAGQPTALGLKVGFCLLDSSRWDPNAPLTGRYDCDSQGIQAGWADRYSSTLPCQWIDITSLAPGVYTLEIEVDPEDRLAEANETNNIARTFVVIDGVCTTAPANDNFSSAQLVEGAIATVIGSNSCATQQSGEPQHAGRAPMKSIWYRWVPNYTGDATITTLGSTFDTLLAVYRGSTLGGLSAVTSNDNAGTSIHWSRVNFRVTNGVPNLIAVDGYLGAVGGVALNINAAGNDRFTNCLPITGQSGTIAGVNIGAGSEAGEPIHGDRSLWYCWTAPASGPVRFHTHGSSMDTRLSVYHGARLTNLTQLATNDDTPGRKTSAVLFEAVAGNLYLIAVSAANEGLVTLTWEPVVIPHITSIMRHSGAYRLLISGRATDQYTIQFSPDLQTWSHRARLTNSTGVVTYNDSGAGLSGFYRAVLLP